MNWDPLQREILGALGHVLYTVDGGGDAPVATPPAAVPGVPQAADDAQLGALLRAANRMPDDTAARDLCRRWLPPGGLRDPAARRALWPRLRALRGSAKA